MLGLFETSQVPLLRPAVSHTVLMALQAEEEADGQAKQLSAYKERRRWGVPTHEAPQPAAAEQAPACAKRGPAAARQQAGRQAAGMCSRVAL